MKVEVSLYGLPEDVEVEVEVVRVEEPDTEEPSRPPIGVGGGGGAATGGGVEEGGETETGPSVEVREWDPEAKPTPGLPQKPFLRYERGPGYADDTQVYHDVSKPGPGWWLSGKQGDYIFIHDFTGEIMTAPMKADGHLDLPVAELAHGQSFNDYYKDWYK